jgi:hypothetical protein
VKTLLFARNLPHATVDYLQHLDPADRRDVIVITSQRDEHRARGMYHVAFCFLDGWWLDWNPVDAYEAHELWPILYGADRVWEIDDVRRTEYARGKMGLPRREIVATQYLLPDEITHDDRWILSEQRDRFAILKGVPGTDSLPGLDDKPGSKNPLGGVVFSEIFDIEDPDSTYPLYADWFIRTHNRDVALYREAERERRAEAEWRAEFERKKKAHEALWQDFIFANLTMEEPNFSLLKGLGV